MTAQRSHFSPWKRFGKWSGSWLGALAWFADQQIVAATVYADCPARTQAFAVGIGVACGLLAIAGGWQSWRVRRGLPAEELASASARTDRFVASISIFIAAMSLLAIVFGSTAGVILRCER